MSVLNAKQKKFCLEYLKDFNATKAALRSGYSERSAGSIGAENLQKPEILEEIKRLSDSLFKTQGLTLNRILNEVMSIAFQSEGTSSEKIKALEILLKYKSLESQTKNRKDLSSSVQRYLEAMRKMKATS